MSSCFVCYRNRWRNGEIIAVSDEAPQFSAEYTQDDSPQLFTRTINVTGEKTWDNDLGTAYVYNFIGILGHNLTAAATIYIKAADDAAFTVNVITDQIFYHGNYIYQILTTARTKRYVRLSITDAANPSGYLQVGTVIVGKAEYFNRMPSVPYQAGQKNETEVEPSASGTVFTVREQPSAFVISLLFLGLDQAAGVMIETLIKENASFLGFVLCLDSSNPNMKSDWLILTEQTLLTCEKVNYWNWNLNAVEVL